MAVTVFEFFGNEPLENVSTCMHFKVDKVVYFGYHDLMQARKESTKYFLNHYCGVSKGKIVFHELSGRNLQSVLKTMRLHVGREKSSGAKIFFDITGGEDLILVAFGMLAREFEAPVHMFDIMADRLIELDEGAKAVISRDIPSKYVKMTLEGYIKLKGGVINESLRKELKSGLDAEFLEDAEKIWEVAKANIKYWNAFSQFLRERMQPDGNLTVRRTAESVEAALRTAPSELDTAEELKLILNGLAEKGILLDEEITDGGYLFRYKNESIKSCLFDGGSVLEFHVYNEQKKLGNDCTVGVHLDWDGVVHETVGSDITNEIDVLSISGNVPTFISCKSGKMDGSQSLKAIYELETVARRFGGKYSKKILVSATEMGDIYVERAKDLGIDVEYAL